MADPIGREVDRVSVRVLPNLKKFLPDLEKYLKKIETRVRVEIPTNLDTAGLMQEAQRAAAEIERAVDVDIPVSANTKAAEAKIATVARTRTATVRVAVDRASLANVLSAVTDMTAGLAGGLAKGGLLGLGVGGIAVSGAALLTVITQATGVLATLPALALGAASAVGILGAAFIGLGDATDELSKNMARELSRIGKAIQTTSRKALFPGLIEASHTFRTEFLPTYLDGLEAIGRKLGEMAKAFADTFATPKILADTKTAMADMTLGMTNLTGAIRPFVNAMADISVVGGSLLPGLSLALTGVTKRFEAFIAEARKSGALEDFIVGSLTAFGALASLLGNIGGALAAIGRAAQNAGGGILGGLDTVFERLHEFLDSARGQTALEGLFSGITRGFEAIGDAMGPVGRALTKTLPALGDVLQTVGEVFGAVLANAAPLVGALALPVANLVGVIGDVLVDLLNAVGPALLPAAKAIGGAISAVALALAPLGPVLAESIGELATAFADMVVQLAPHIAPIVSAIVDQLLPLIPSITTALVALMPGLTEFFVVLAEALPGLLEAFGPLLQAVVDILPPLAELTSTLLLLGAAALEMYLPFQTMANSAAFGALAESISGFLTPTLQALADVLSGDLKGAVDGIVPALAGMLSAVITNVSSVAALIATLPASIAVWFDGFDTLLFDAGFGLIQGLVDGINDAAASVLAGALAGVAGRIAGFFPGSPVKEGPLRSWNNGGSGKALMDLFTSGIEARTGGVRSAAKAVAGLFDDPSMQPQPAAVGSAGGPLFGDVRVEAHDYNDFVSQMQDRARASAIGGTGGRWGRR